VAATLRAKGLNDAAAVCYRRYFGGDKHGGDGDYDADGFTGIGGDNNNNNNDDGDDDDVDDGGDVRSVEDRVAALYGYARCIGDVGGATAFVTSIRVVLCSLRTQISGSICHFAHCINHNNNNNPTINVPLHTLQAALAGDPEVTHRKTLDVCVRVLTLIRSGMALAAAGKGRVRDHRAHLVLNGSVLTHRLASTLVTYGAASTGKLRATLSARVFCSFSPFSRCFVWC
jgi:hypothetical protein